MSRACWQRGPLANEAANVAGREQTLIRDVEHKEEPHRELGIMGRNQSKRLGHLGKDPRAGIADHPLESRAKPLDIARVVADEPADRDGDSTAR